MMEDDLHPSVRHIPTPTSRLVRLGHFPRTELRTQRPGGCSSSRRATDKGRCRIFPTKPHQSWAASLHGGAIMTLHRHVDVRRRPVRRGASAAHYVTLDLHHSISLAAARPGSPLDADVELLRETGGLAFFRGLVIQDGETIATLHRHLEQVTRPNGRERGRPERYRRAARRRRAEAGPGPGSAPSPRSTGIAAQLERKPGLLARLFGRAATGRCAASISGAASGAASRC